MTLTDEAMTAAMELARQRAADRARIAALEAELARLREHMGWIEQQRCDRSGTARRVCPESEDGMTEWCLSCYAWAVLHG